MTFLSYLMGAPSIGNQELEHIGIEIVGETDSGSRKLKIPESALENYKNLIRKKMDNGFWNDILGVNEIFFIFKLKDGKIKEFTLCEECDDDEIEEIAELCSSLNGDPIEKTLDIYNYLADNDFYSDYIKHFHKKQTFGTKNPDMIYRRTIVGVVFDPENKKILGLEWKIFPCPGLVIGGVEESEDLEKAMKREMIEETGFTDFKIVTKLGRELDAFYFANNKNQWRHAEMHGFLIKLNSMQQEKQALEKGEEFELKWYEPKEFIEIVNKQDVTDEHDFRPLSEFIKRALLIL